MSTVPTEARYRFDDFLLDVPNRQLWRGGARVDLNARYFDALALLVREHGQLIGKERFFAEVWGDVVVGDAALTQCIKDVRKLLGDAAAHPRYVQTVPRYGYRFIGPVEPATDAPATNTPVTPPVTSPAVDGADDDRVGRAFHAVLRDGVAGALGGGLAGVLGGALYGFALAAAPGDGLGTASVLVVLVGLCASVGLAGGFGVGAGRAAAALAVPGRAALHVAGAALGGGLVGTLAKLLGVDAFHLLFGRAPAGITGGPEGLALGAALALGLAVGGGPGATRRGRPVLAAALAGGAAGVGIPLAGGRLMGGSLELLAHSFAGSRLQLDSLGRFFGEVRFGNATQVALGGIEGLLFGAGVAAALVVAHRARPATTAVPA